MLAKFVNYLPDVSVLLLALANGLMDLARAAYLSLGVTSAINLICADIMCQGSNLTFLTWVQLAPGSEKPGAEVMNLGPTLP